MYLRRRSSWRLWSFINLKWPLVSTLCLTPYQTPIIQPSLVWCWQNWIWFLYMPKIKNNFAIKRKFISKTSRINRNEISTFRCSSFLLSSSSTNPSFITSSTFFLYATGTYIYCSNTSKSLRTQTLNEPCFNFFFIWLVEMNQWINNWLEKREKSKMGVKRNVWTSAYEHFLESPSLP